MRNYFCFYLFRYVSLAMLAFTVLWLSGCAVPSGQISGASKQSEWFERVGRFSVSSEEADGTQEAVQGSFAWLDTHQKLAIDLNNPMGATLARVQVYNDHAILERSNGTQEVSSSADSLIEQALGISVPVANLRYWLQGHTGPGKVQNMQTGPNSYPQEFNQYGWRVRLSRYDQLGPTIVQLSRSDYQRRINIRLAITK